MPTIIPRWANNELLTQLTIHRVVSVIGCRQSGKTTMLLTAPLPNIKFKSLDVTANFSSAVADPGYFVSLSSRDDFGTTRIWNLKTTAKAAQTKGKLLPGRPV